MNLKTIAREAGVSTATVSNVINGNHHKVSQETIAKVQRIIEENNYKPNATARSLASKKSKIIGVVVPNISEGQNFFLNPHDTYMLALLEQYIREQGYFMMMRCVLRAKEVIPLFSSWNVDGMVFFGTFRDEIQEIKHSLSVPAVFIDAYAEDLGIASVGVDDYKGGYLAAGYLLGKGHRNIALVCPEVDHGEVIGQRYQGFCRACGELGVTIRPEDVFYATALYESGLSAGQAVAMSGRGYTAVWAMSDIAALGVMEGLRGCGRNVPGDVSVMGFDNLPECAYSNPKLTTISQDIEQKARKVGRSLFKMINDEEAAPVSEKNDVAIVERQSVKDINI